MIAKKARLVSINIPFGYSDGVKTGAELWTFRRKREGGAGEKLNDPAMVLVRQTLFRNRIKAARTPGVATQDTT